LSYDRIAEITAGVDEARAADADRGPIADSGALSVSRTAHDRGLTASRLSYLCRALSYPCRALSYPCRALSYLATLVVNDQQRTASVIVTTDRAVTRPVHLASQKANRRVRICGGVPVRPAG
jgi:hypothetical protein